MIDVEGVVGVALLLLWIYCIFDVIASDSAVIRNLPKPMWLFIVFFIPDIGSIAWLLLGRPEKAGWRPGDTALREERWSGGSRRRWGFAPDAQPTSDDAILERDRLIAQWEAEDAARKQELRERIDRETQARKRAAEERLIEARRRDRETEKHKAMEAPLPTEDDEPAS